MGQETETAMLQRALTRVWMKIFSTLGALLLTGIVIGLWRTYTDVQELKRTHQEVAALKRELKIHDQRMDAIESAMRAGPEWMRDRLSELRDGQQELKERVSVLERR